MGSLSKSSSGIDAAISVLLDEHSIKIAKVFDLAFVRFSRTEISL